MTRARFLPMLLVAAGCATPADHTSMKVRGPVEVHEEAPVAGPMLLLGSGPYYLATDEGFFEATMVKSGQDPAATLNYDRQVTGEKIYVVVPEPFAMTELTNPAASPVRRTFKADVVRGHPERGGSLILSRLTFKVQRVVYAEGKGASQRLPVPQYLLFGSRKDLFAARIPHAGSRRQIFSVRVRDGIFDPPQADLLARGAFVRSKAEFRLGVANEAEARIGTETLPVAVEALAEIYSRPDGR